MAAHPPSRRSARKRGDPEAETITSSADQMGKNESNVLRGWLRPAKLKDHTRSLDCNFIPERLLRLQIFVSKNYNARTILKLTLCRPKILSKVGQVAQKQRTQT